MALLKWPHPPALPCYVLEVGGLESLGPIEVLRGDLVSQGREKPNGRSQAGDVDGAYVAAYDAYRMAAEALLGRQGLRATGGDGSHMAVEDAVSAQFGDGIPAFAKPTFERLRRTRHTAQYFDPSAAPISSADR